VLQPTLLLAHAGAGQNPWFGILTIAAVVVVVVFVLAALDRVALASPGDLLLPFATVVLLSGLGGSLGDGVADRAPVAVPVLTVLVGALVLAASTTLTLRFTRPLGWGAAALAVVAAVTVSPALESTFFPLPEALPVSVDAEATLRLVEGPDADGRVTVEVAVTGGSLGPGPTDRPNDDLEEGLLPRFVAGPAFVAPVAGPVDCATSCTSSTYELVLPVTADGTLPDLVQVELLTSTELPFAPPLRASADVPVG
jgi:hypothetical protein